jgi:hypothetical protein
MIHYFFFVILMIFLISLPIFLFWEWNRNRENTLKEILKKLWKKNKIYFAVFLGIITSEFFIPLNTNHGIEFNTEREKLGIPKLEVNWEKDKTQFGKYTTSWWKPKPRNGHFKKVIEYGIFNAKYEIDYYQNKNKKGTFIWSKYDFKNNKFEYFIEKPNSKNDSVSYKGKFKLEKPTILKEINKFEFEKNIKTTGNTV